MNKQKGFTLVELMIAIAIIGVLASIAYPGYKNQIAKSRRADAKGALTSFANAMERRFTEIGQYTGAADGNGVPLIFPTKTPIDGTDTYYNLTVSQITANSYMLSATPVNNQAEDRCGILTLTNTGVRGVSKSTVADCW